MNRRDMIRALGLAGVGTALLPTWLQSSIAHASTGVDVWEASGLLEGLSPVAKTKMSVLLTNVINGIPTKCGKYTTEDELSFSKLSFPPVVRFAVNPFIENDRFQTMRQPASCHTSNMTALNFPIAAKTSWTKIHMYVTAGVNLNKMFSGFYQQEWEAEYLQRNLGIPLRDTIDELLNRRYGQNGVLYVYNPIVFTSLVPYPDEPLSRRYGAFIRYATSADGIRESI